MEAGTSSFSKPRRNRGNIRKRAAEEETDETATGETSEQDIVRKAKTQKSAPLAFSTKQESQKGPLKLLYESERVLQQSGDQGATRTLETETETDRDARQAFLLKMSSVVRDYGKSQSEAGTADDGLYKGMNNYTDHRKGFRREQTIASEKGGGAHGPLRAPSNIRMTVRFDYQPDICKDYKETGYCGYGDACKFIHDRGDYKSGWELDREWNERQKRIEEAKWEANSDEESEEEKEDDVPFACYICRKPWAELQDPVVTRCKHYFCEKCALRHNSLNKGKCAVCEQATGGIFNIANDVTKRMREQKDET